MVIVIVIAIELKIWLIINELITIIIIDYIIYDFNLGVKILITFRLYEFMILVGLILIMVI